MKFILCFSYHIPFQLLLICGLLSIGKHAFYKYLSNKSRRILVYLVTYIQNQSHTISFYIRGMNIIPSFRFMYVHTYVCVYRTSPFYTSVNMILITSYRSFCVQAIFDLDYQSFALCRNSDDDSCFRHYMLPP